MATRYSLALTLTLITLGPLAFDAQSNAQETAVYDNTHLIPNDAIAPSSPDDLYLAQPFITGDGDVIRTITLRLNRVGSPTGSIDVEIWDDDGSGLPGERIATVETIELDELPSRRGPFTTIDRPVRGLIPRSPYYLVLSNVDAGIVSQFNSYEFPTTASSDGTFGANSFLVTFLDEWTPLNSIIGPNGNYLQMAVTTIESLLGDFDMDGRVDVNDINLLFEQMRCENCNDEFFDLTADGSVGSDDRDTWVTDIADTFFGDANLDGEFKTSDLVLVFQAGQYEDSVAMNSSWMTGDWDGNGDFTSSDLVLAFQEGGYEQGPRPALATVPEPAGFIMMRCALALAFLISRRKCAS